MKRCPECRRDYYDDTLSFCLNDGTPLVQGSVPGVSDDGPATAILHTTDAVGDAPTRARIHTTEQTAVLPSGISDLPKRSLDKRLIAATFLLAIIVLAGFFGYRYWNSSAKQIESIAVMPFVNERRCRIHVGRNHGEFDQQLVAASEYESHCSFKRLSIQRQRS